jgi:hypothetical protein
MRQSLALALILLPALAGCGGSDHERVNPEVMLDQASAHRISNANVEIDAIYRFQESTLPQPSGCRWTVPT